MRSSSSLTVQSTGRPRCLPPASFAVSTQSIIMLPVRILSTSSIITICSCCCVLLFSLCFRIFTFCLRCGFFCGDGFIIVLLSMISWYLFRAQASQLRCFSCLVASLMLYHVVFSFSILVMVILSRHGDRESRHDTSVWIMSLASASFIVSQVSSLGTVRPKKPSDLIPWAQKIEFESCK